MVSKWVTPLPQFVGVVVMPSTRVITFSFLWLGFFEFVLQLITRSFVCTPALCEKTNLMNYGGLQA